MNLFDMKLLDQSMTYQVQRERVLHQVIQAIHDSLDLEAIFATAIEEIGKLLQVDHAKISQYLPNRKAWLTVAHYRSCPDLPMSIGQEIPDQGNLVTVQLKRLEIVRIDDTNLCEDEVSREMARTFPGAWLIVPLHFQGSVWGSLCLLIEGHPHHWQQEEVELASIIAAQLAIAIQHWQLSQQVQQLSTLEATQKVAGVGSWEFNALTGDIIWSEQKFRMFGLDPTQSAPTYDQLLEMIRADDRESFQQTVNRALAEGTSYEIVFRIKRPSGEIRYIEARGEPIFNTAGQVIQLFGTVVDITAHNLAKSETLKALQRERELSEAKSRFIAMTSHDFRTPLTTIQSSVDLLRRYPKKLSSERQQVHLHRISNSVEQMTQMMQDVLMLSEAEAGKLQLNLTSVDLVKLCHSLIAELRVSDKKHHEITFTYPGDCTATQTSTTSQESEESISTQYPVDEKLIRYILTNLLSNALKYSPQGSRIQFDFTCHADQVVFHIQDQGIGIPSEDVPRLFESFYRASNVGVTQGTGLGLAIVQQCVDLHGGQISVDSAVGKGTTFTVTLPLS
ncbi:MULTISPECIES: ATP-binding protein [unclassified Coleofasciculus]|uniref:ATP-binding protein n=1 Tax=unclassified Coleofasciculus TaxID=2692782 RepID=UPI001882DFF6|nr:MULTISPECIES: ATP-binding protein [unclassified Coleofasciculus]MBE9129718.1 PAS domain-containing protein [Coleofasciculus sp. LEGE 07081]MBE9151084.1 PAS domain-containing protein [Coleofasciculus sp. LEGE 07092]